MEFNLKINPNDINYILNLLAERPYKESVKLIDSITEQAKSQQKEEE